MRPVSSDCGTSTWKAGGVYVDRFKAKLTSAGSFSLKIGFFRSSEGDGPWQHLAGPGAESRGFEVESGGVELGTIVVTPHG